MPYGTVNLKDGVPEGETTVTCTAGVGTYIVEFGTLSRLTGDPVYEEVIFVLYVYKFIFYFCFYRILYLYDVERGANVNLYCSISVFFSGN